MYQICVYIPLVHPWHLASSAMLMEPQKGFPFMSPITSLATKIFSVSLAVSAGEHEGNLKPPRQVRLKGSQGLVVSFERISLKVVDSVSLTEIAFLSCLHIMSASS